MFPYGKQSIDEGDIRAVVEVLQSDFLTTGPKIQEFENALCEVTNAKHAIVCGNGTEALHLSCMAVGVGPDDCVIVPSTTFLATANCARYCGAEVVFSDVNPRTGLMEGEHLIDALSRCGDLKPRAVIPVHLNGQCAPLNEIKQICSEHKLKLIADSCHALGTTYNDKPVGSCEFEDMAVFSFHPVKTIAMGEGGAITTQDDELAEKMRLLRNHGMKKVPEKGPWYYEMEHLGYNYREPDILCALGISQLKKLRSFAHKRQELSATYDNLLKPLHEYVQPIGRVKNCTPVWHLYAVQFDFDRISYDRAELMQRLLAEGVGTQVHYIPVHTQPYYTNRYGDIDLPGSQSYYSRVLSLPLYPAMAKADVEGIVNIIEKVIRT